MMTPGRSCPIHYRYNPAVLATLEPQPINHTVYVIGGLYGNHLALEQILTLQQADHDPTLVFNGDFNWFNKTSDNFQNINREVLRHLAIAGNVEKELIHPDDSIGCGCSYPGWVTDDTVLRSNEIIKQLQKTASKFPEILNKLNKLPITMRVNLGETRVLILHGDPESLAGWGLSFELLNQSSHQEKLKDWFGQTQVDIICCTHTCLPAVKRLKIANQEKLIINNGAAGMGNFLNDSSGLIIRISSQACPDAVESCYQTHLNGLYLDLVKINFDDLQWQQKFTEDWPAGSPAYESYFSRIQNGTSLMPNQIIL